MKKVAVILGGCGSCDGSEINEAVMALLALDQHGVKYQCFAPDRDQYEVVNSLTGAVMMERRNMMVEAARIARGEVKPLRSLDASDYDALVIPGGVGTAKNLFTYFINGVEMTVLPEVEKAIRDIHAQGKPIGAMCIAPVVVAKVLGNVSVTLGDDNCAPAKDIKTFGASHIATEQGGLAVDRENKIFTTPCFMLKSTLKDIYEGADKMIEAMGL